MYRYKYKCKYYKNINTVQKRKFKNPRARVVVELKYNIAM